MSGPIIFTLVLILLESIGGILLVIFQSQSSAKDKEEIQSLNKKLLEKSEELNKFLSASDTTLFSSNTRQSQKMVLVKVGTKFSQGVQFIPAWLLAFR